MGKKAISRTRKLAPSRKWSDDDPLVNGIHPIRNSRGRAAALKGIDRLRASSRGKPRLAYLEAIDALINH